MNTAWETTLEDVEIVLDKHDLDLDAAEVFESLNMDDITDAALFGIEMEEQTVYAFQEIEHQLIQQGHLPEGTESKFSI